MIFLFCVCLAPGVEAETMFQVGIWEDGRPRRAEAFHQALQEVIGYELQMVGYSGIEWEATRDYERRYSQLGEGRLALMEVDPATYFLARRRWMTTDPGRWQYELLFQQLSSLEEASSLRAVIVSLESSGMNSLRDLQGKVLGILSPYGLAQGAIQLSALRRAGLIAGRDVQILQADSEENLCKALFSGLVDAIALPEGHLEEFLRRETGEESIHKSWVNLFTSDLLPEKVWCVHRRLIRNSPDLVSQIRQRLPKVWNREILQPTRDDYYLTLNALLQSDE